MASYVAFIDETARRSGQVAVQAIAAVAAAARSALSPENGLRGAVSQLVPRPLARTDAGSAAWIAFARHGLLQPDLSRTSRLTPRVWGTRLQRADLVVVDVRGLPAQCGSERPVRLRPAAGELSG